MLIHSFRMFTSRFHLCRLLFKALRRPRRRVSHSFSYFWCYNSQQQPVRRSLCCVLRAHLLDAHEFLGGGCSFANCTCLVLLSSWVEPDLGHWQLRSLCVCLPEGGRAEVASMRTKRRKKAGSTPNPCSSCLPHSC